MIITFVTKRSLQQAVHILGKHGYYEGDPTFKVNREDKTIEVNDEWDQAKKVEKFLQAANSHD